MKKLVTIVGARPQFIKAAAISRKVTEERKYRLEEILVHTGQHHDDNMSKVFFDDLDIAKPKYNLGISGGEHGAMTGRMLEAIEKVLMLERPDWLLIYGDTNSTLAGALAAAKLHIPIAHVEAGLRSFNNAMPEEINRIIADRVSEFLFCPTDTAVANLKAENRIEGVYNVGDVMFDVALFYAERSKANSTVLARLGVMPKKYILATCHRAENTNSRDRLAAILIDMAKLASEMPVILPLHPRTAMAVDKFGLNDLLIPLTLTEPLSFLDMVALERNAIAILTDSGGVQKEAFFYNTPCITMRDETEWTETIKSGWNYLVKVLEQSVYEITLKALQHEYQQSDCQPYGDGNAAARILSHLE